MPPSYCCINLNSRERLLPIRSAAELGKGIHVGTESLVGSGCARRDY